MTQNVTTFNQFWERARYNGSSLVYMCTHFKQNLQESLLTEVVKIFILRRYRSYWETRVQFEIRLASPPHHIVIAPISQNAKHLPRVNYANCSKLYFRFRKRFLWHFHNLWHPLFTFLDSAFLHSPMHNAAVWRMGTYSKAFRFQLHSAVIQVLPHASPTSVFSVCSDILRTKSIKYCLYCQYLGDFLDINVWFCSRLKWESLFYNQSMQSYNDFIFPKQGVILF